MKREPRASSPFNSYRYKGPYGFIYVGARSDIEALSEVERSLTSGRADPRMLTKWIDGEYRELPR